MTDLATVTKQLEPRHKAAVAWFFARAGSDGPWPGPLPDGTLLATKAKGIYKPEWSPYALSVRQSIDSPYSDREPVARGDGTWYWLYYQEGGEPAERDSRFPNRGLMSCIKDEIPVGVFRENQSGASGAYHFLGIAVVSGWEEGYFLLEGFSSTGQCHRRGPQPWVDYVTTEAEKQLEAEPFHPQSIADERKRVLAEIVRRRGQPKFRSGLLAAYGGRCAVTECDVAEVLEAAHILPYKGPATNHIANGVLLRGDIHTLFDLGLIAVDSASMTIVVSPELSETRYRELSGRKLRLPADPGSRPSQQALDQHRAWCGL